MFVPSGLASGLLVSFVCFIFSCMLDAVMLCLAVCMYGYVVLGVCVAECVRRMSLSISSRARFAGESVNAAKRTFRTGNCVLPKLAKSVRFSCTAQRSHCWTSVEL